MTAPARRRLLAAMGGAALAPSLPLAAAGADAALVGWCARFAGAEDDYERVIEPYPDGVYPAAVNARLDALRNVPRSSPAPSAPAASGWSWATTPASPPPG